MDRLALRSVNLGLFAAVLGASTAVFAQEAPAAPAAEAPAPVEAPAAPPAPAEPAPAPAPVEAAPMAAEAPPAAPAAAKPKPPPYSLPWQLRPVVAATVLRSDTAFAFYKDAAGKESGSTVASMLLFSYKVNDNLAPLVRVGVVHNRPPVNMKAGGKDFDKATHFLNPILGATYALKPAKPLRLALFLGVSLPIGGGGGDDADIHHAQANLWGIRARSAMDNAMFTPNDLGIIPGVGFAYVGGGFTAQVEATLIQLMRVKGDKVPAMGTAKNPDSSKTNLTMGLHLGYFVIPQLSIGAEIRHQRFLSTPKAVEADEASTNMTPLGLRDTTSFAVGPRAHFKFGESVWFRPGVAFSMGLDDPNSKFKHKVVQLDLPFAF